MAVPSNSDSSEEVPPMPAPNSVENFRRVMTEMLADMSPTSFNNFRQVLTEMLGQVRLGQVRLGQVLTEMSSIFEEHQRRMPPETLSPLRPVPPAQPPKKVRHVFSLLLAKVTLVQVSLGYFFIFVCLKKSIQAQIIWEMLAEVRGLKKVLKN